MLKMSLQSLPQQVFVPRSAEPMISRGAPGDHDDSPTICTKCVDFQLYREFLKSQAHLKLLYINYPLQELIETTSGLQPNQCYFMWSPLVMCRQLTCGHRGFLQMSPPVGSSKNSRAAAQNSAQPSMSQTTVGAPLTLALPFKPHFGSHRQCFRLRFQVALREKPQRDKARRVSARCAPLVGR